MSRKELCISGRHYCIYLRHPEYGGVTDSANEAVKALPAGILDYDALGKSHIVELNAPFNVKSIAQIHMDLSLAELCDWRKWRHSGVSWRLAGRTAEVYYRSAFLGMNINREKGKTGWRKN